MATSLQPLTSAEPANRRSREGKIARRDRLEAAAAGTLEVAQLPLLIGMWLDYGRVRRQAARTLETRRMTLERLAEYLRENGHERCARAELLAFFASLVNKNTGEPLRPWTTVTIYSHLQAFFRWLVAEGILDASPLAGVPRPIRRYDQIQPLSNEQVRDLLAAARNSYYPRHNEALLRFLLDTGVRATELCGIRMGDLDMRSRSVLVTGKGNKKRSVPFGATVSRALWAYLRGRDYEVGLDDHEPLFCACSGPNQGGKLTRLGVLQAVNRLGKAAGITGVRCSPHTLRHTFAVNFIRNGGDPFTLMQILGHTDLQMTNRYVKLAKADIANQHAKFSPMDNMGF